MIGAFTNLFKPQYIAIGSALIFLWAILISVFSVTINHYLSRDTHNTLKKDNEELINHYRNDVFSILKELKAARPADEPTLILKDGKILEIEEHGNFAEIWIVSPNLSNDTDLDRVIRVVRSNLKKGVKYVYFTPKVEEAKGRIRSLHNRYHPFADKIYLVLVPLRDQEFFTTTHVAIYGPNDEKQRVFWELPLKGAEHWVECEPEFSKKLVNHFCNLEQTAVRLDKYLEGNLKP